MRNFEPHICGALSGSKAICTPLGIPAQHFDTAYHIATSHTHTSLYTYGTVTPTPQAYARKEEDKPEARAVCGVRDWRLFYPEGAERAREDIPSGAATMRILAWVLRRPSHLHKLQTLLSLGSCQEHEPRA